MSKMFFLFEEFAGGFQLVAHNAEEFAAFLKDVQVDERYFVVGGVGLLLHAVDVRLAQNG